MPYGITTGPDGNVWFTEFAGNKIGRITPSGGITEYPLAPYVDETGTTSGPVRIVLGPDDHLWFTEGLPANRVGKVSASGIVTQFDRWISTPAGLTAGPDGNVWLSIPQLDLIRVVTPTGTVLRDHQLPSSFLLHTSPNGITTGPDGNLWFTSSARAEVGKLTPAGSLTEYPTPAIPGHPIRAGRDGNLWFPMNQSLAKMTTSGELTLYPVSEIGSGLAVAPDGNLWFTSRGAIGTMTPSGALATYPVPDAGTIIDIAVGSDGNIWFTDQDNNRIGRFSPSPTPRDFLPVAFFELTPSS